MKMSRNQKKRRDKMVKLAVEILYSDMESQLTDAERYHPYSIRVGRVVGQSFRKFIDEVVRKDL